MSQRLTQKQIKQDIRQDEVRTFILRIFDRFQENPTLFIGAIVALLALVLATTGLVAFLDSREEQANTELAEAIRIFDAPVGVDAPEPDDELAPSFATAEERRERLQQALDDVDAGDAAAIAGLYRAEMAISEGKNDEARAAWEAFLDGNADHALALAVRVNLIHLDRAEGKVDEVAETLASELASSTKSMPEDLILFELARTYEMLERDDDARELYQRIVDEHPESPYTAEARRMTTSGGAGAGLPTFS
ncbi:MAG: tetratricopeptide repeat protein [Acidobacteriota bacterium]